MINFTTKTEMQELTNYRRRYNEARRETFNKLLEAMANSGEALTAQQMEDVTGLNKTSILNMLCFSDVDGNYKRGGTHNIANYLTSEISEPSIRRTDLASLEWWKESHTIYKLETSQKTITKTYVNMDDPTDVIKKTVKQSRTYKITK